MTAPRTLVCDFGEESGRVPRRIVEKLKPLRSLLGVFCSRGEALAGPRRSVIPGRDLRWSWSHAPHERRGTPDLLDPWSWPARHLGTDPATLDKRALPAWRAEVRRSAASEDEQELALGEVHSDREALRARLEALPPGEYVLKPVSSSAGRGFLRVRLPLDPQAVLPRGLPTVILEPWRTRTGDFGSAALMSSEGELLWCGGHEQIVSAEGRFLGVRVLPRAGGVDDTHRSAWLAAHVVPQLAQAGHAGPFSVDSYTWRDDTGAERLEFLCEVNARMSFGHAAHAHAARLRREGETVDELWLTVDPDWQPEAGLALAANAWHIAPDRAPRRL